jgi:predicted ester cyclase
MAATDATRSERYAEITRRVAEEAWGGGNYEVIDESIADGFVSHNTAVPEDVRGREAYKELIGQFRSAMPDLEVQVEETLVDGDAVAIRFATSGTHQGELMGIEPTGRKVEGSGLVIVHYEGDEAVEVWEYGDQLGMLQQLGVKELPGA